MADLFTKLTQLTLEISGTHVTEFFSSHEPCSFFLGRRSGWTIYAPLTEMPRARGWPPRPPFQREFFRVESPPPTFPVIPCHFPIGFPLTSWSRACRGRS